MARQPAGQGESGEVFICRSLKTKRRACATISAIPNVSGAPSLQFGLPKFQQTSFLVDLALQNTLPASEDIIRSHICALDKIEHEMSTGVIDRLAADQLDGIKLRPNEGDLMEAEYVRRAMRLSDDLGVPVYQYSARFRNAGGVLAGNIPVRH